MLFNSFAFLVFFPIVVILYFVIPHKARWALLVAASLYFYMYFKPVYIFILAVIIPNSYFAALSISCAKSEKRKKRIIFLSVAVNLAVLFFFKYFDFANANISSICDLLGFRNPVPFLDIVLPLGISFYTFQAISYIVDVYRDVQTAEKKFHIFTAYIVFFPQLVAGPIERAQNLLHQFYSKHTPEYSRITEGMKLMAWGFFQKIVIADRLAIIVDHVYDSVQEQGAVTLILAAILFAIQVYCDFSGYTDIARGAAKILGFDLVINFNKPLSSGSISEFWRRWHISLSTWVNDYIYNPVSFKRRYWGTPGTIYTVILTFFLLGLWHGASWTFAVFGLLHGLAICYEILTQRFRKIIFSNIPASMVRPLSVFFTFTFYCFGGIFFRSDSLNKAGIVIARIFSGAIPETGPFPGVNEFSKYFLGASFPELVFSLVLVILIFTLDQRRQNGTVPELITGKSAVIRWITYNIVLLM
ncbi:MAG: MBOAT family protein, partial [Bacteroidetes bacterium]|nr:MBOAT family protein [Bacteroidota bacterium]